MKNYVINNITVIFVVLLTACDVPVQEAKIEEDHSYEDVLLSTNVYSRERNRQHIIAFSERLGWDMKETSSGLWYRIIKEGSGPRIEKNRFLSYEFRTSLIDGRLCYVSDSLNPKKIIVGKGNIEAGLEEGLQLLREGSEAIFIIPPYLAHGNFGDRNKIPGASIIIVEVGIVEVKR